MRRVRSAMGWVVLATGVAGAQTGRAGTGGVSGHVYSAETNQPLRFATVQLQAAGSGGTGRGGGGGGGSASTDLDGAFVIGNVAPGTYAVSARMPGYVDAGGMLASQMVDGSAATGGAVNSGLTTVRVVENQVTPAEVRMERGAALAGTVRYEDGTPAVGVDVRLEVKNGQGVWVPSMGFGGQVRTNDEGRYREAGLLPGTYAVEASLPAMSVVSNGLFQRWGSGVRSNQGGALRVYSGNVFRVKSAVGVEMRAGEERTGIDVQIPLSGLHRVAGVVDAVSSGRSVGAGQVKLLDAEDKTVVRQTSIVSGGSFAFENVPTGNYLVEVDARPERGESQQGVSYAALTQALVVEGDQTGLAYSVADAR